MRALAAGLVLVALVAGAARADDRHEGYYYPEVTSSEVYVARVQPDPTASRTTRVAFAIDVTSGLMSRPHPPDYALFVKGSEAEKLIIVALREGVIDTLYRGRALLALMTGVVRNSELFEKLGVQESFTFFDLARLMGFDQLTISDGRTYAHQVTFE
jgi:hypothetical protein